MKAIQKIAGDEIYIEQGLMKNLPLQNFEADYQTILDSLSARKFDVFLLLAKGLTTHKIGDELCLSYKTVANYGTQIKSKFKVSTVAELAHIAMIQGMLNS